MCRATSVNREPAFEIIPVHGRSCVCGHSARDRLTPRDEFRWAWRWKMKPVPLSSIHSLWAGKLALRLPPQISQAVTVKGDNTGFFFFFHSKNQIHLREQELKELRARLWWNTKRIVWFFGYKAQSAAHLIKHADLFAGIIKYSLLLNVLQVAHRIHGAPLRRIIRFLCRTVTNAIFHLMRYEFKSNFPFYIHFTLSQPITKTQKRGRRDEMEVIPHLIGFSRRICPLSAKQKEQAGERRRRRLYTDYLQKQRVDVWCA